MTIKPVTYSVYDYNRRCYDYYQALGEVPASGWMRAPTSSVEAPERLCARLPSNAVPVGSGKQAKGLIAVSSMPDGGFLSGLGALADSPGKLAVVVGGLAAAAVVWAWRRDKKG